MREIIVRPEAEAEVQAAFDWYEEKSVGLGLDFLRAIDDCLLGIERYPLSNPVVHLSVVRRAVVRKFPYTLFYLADDSAIIVLAVFNVKRQPIQWRNLQG
jgi:toxin ParE1/3/4